MKKLTFLFFAIMATALSWQGTAQVVTVLSDGATANAGTQVYPLGNHEGFERSASIYTYLNQINRYGVIKGIAWEAIEGGKGERPIKIYMKKIVPSTYRNNNPAGTWANRIAGATLVFDGMIDPVQGWNMIPLQTPFVFDDLNLEVLVEANYGGTGNGGGVDGNKIRYARFPNNTTPHAIWKSNNNAPTGNGLATRNRPQIQLEFSDNEIIDATGFSHDVIAEGSNFNGQKDFDNGGNYLYAETFRNGLWELYKPEPGTGLIDTRWLANLLPEGPAAYKLQPYNGKNALHLAKNGTGTLNVTHPKALQELYLLHASGNGPTTFKVTITFEDNSTQVISNLTSPDWVTGANDGVDIAYKKVMRVRQDGLFGYHYYTDNTIFYQTKLLIDESNIDKKITKITLNCTENTNNNSRFNLMAVAGKATPTFTYVYRNGAWNADPSGVSTYGDDILVVNGETSFTANTQARNITIRSGATLNISHVLNIAGNIENNGDLVFLSDENADGELGPVPSTSVISGEATVHRYMSAHRSYRLLSSAVNTSTSIKTNWQEGVNNPDFNTNLDPHPGFGTHITGSNPNKGFDVTQTGNKSLYTVNVVTQSFEAVPNTNETNLVAGKGYLMMVRGDRSINLNDPNYNPTSTVLRAKGQLAVGDISIAFPSPAVETEESFVVFGNPYQSAVDMTQVLANSTNLKTTKYYIYDPTLADQGAWITVDFTAGQDPSSDANEYLQPGQAAQAQMNVAAASTVKFKEIHKAPGHHTNTSATSNTPSNLLTVQLYTTENFINGGRVHDSFRILFDDSFTNALTDGDAIKPLNFSENFGINLDGIYLSLERREMPQAEEVYQLYSTGYSHSEYSLNLMVDGLEDTLLYLEDHFTGSSTPLEAGATFYNFSVDANNELSKATDRFSIRTEARLGVEDNSALAGVRLFPNPLNDSTFYINAPKLDGETVSITVNDMLGREIANTQQTFSGSTVKIDLSQDLKSGVYMVTISSNGTDKTLRIIKR
jgi:hypothetical protein